MAATVEVVFSADVMALDSAVVAVKEDDEDNEDDEEDYSFLTPAISCLLPLVYQVEV